MKPSEIITAIQCESRCSFVRTEALYHLWGKKNGYTPMRVKAHWFLEQRPSGFIVDITPDDSKEFDFDDASPTGFMTDQPSISAQRVIDSIRLGESAVT